MTKIEKMSEYYSELKGLKHTYKELWNCREFTKLNISGENGAEMGFSICMGFNAHHNLNKPVLYKSVRKCMINLQEMILMRKNEILSEINELVNNILTEDDIEDSFWEEFKIKSL